MQGVIWPAYAAIFALAEPLIKNAEGFEPSPYLCQAGVPTIGWGTTHYPDGRPVKLTDKPCGEAEAQIWLECSMHRVLDALESGTIITRAPNCQQAVAFLSLAYNVGVGAHDGKTGDLADSTLFAHFNSGDVAGAAAHFLDWDKLHDPKTGAVEVSSGLLKRRQAEQRLFLSASENELGKAA
jgi:lysozyme